MSSTFDGSPPAGIAAEDAVDVEYENALRQVMGLPDFERSSHSPGHSSLHLERMSLLLDRLNAPHLDVPTVHVAGTNGKGSTAAMVTSILRAEGYKTGLYTSPHLHSAVERIRVGMEPVSRRRFAGLVDHVWPAAEWVAREGAYGPLTFFELLTAMAFVHFNRIGADVQVLEVGLGGRLDATNVVIPDVCVITPISLDHVATLGNTVELIAAEKAGIVKRDVPVVVSPQTPAVAAVIRRVAAERGAPVVELDGKVSWRAGSRDLSGQAFRLEGLRGRYDLWTPLLGDHQIENAAVAVATVETLAARGLGVSSQSIVEGLRTGGWPARLQVLGHRGAQVVVDGAHNPSAARRLVPALRGYFRCDRVILVFGALTGHAAGEVLSELAGLSPTVLAVRSRHPRSAPAERVAGAARELGLQVAMETEDVGSATRQALEMAGEGDLVLGTGSLSVAAEVTEEICGIRPELYPSLERAGTSRKG